MQYLYTSNCVVADVSDFKYRDIKMFLLRRGSELQILVNKIQYVMKI